MALYVGEGSEREQSPLLMWVCVGMCIGLHVHVCVTRVLMYVCMCRGQQSTISFLLPRVLKSHDVV